MFRVYDCLSDIELAIKPTRKEAEEIRAIHGGADNCIHVFEVEEPKITDSYFQDIAKCVEATNSFPDALAMYESEIKERKPSKGELF